MFKIPEYMKIKKKKFWITRKSERGLQKKLETTLDWMKM